LLVRVLAGYARRGGAVPSIGFRCGFISCAA
jgi:hypothetical protein